jgi:2-phosphoglycerate kinase
MIGKGRLKAGLFRTFAERAKQRSLRGYTFCMKNILLIGGAEGMGKTTLAKQLAEHWRVPWISTDQIRTILQITEPDEERKAAVVWKGVAALVRAPHPWDGAVIEGTAILPDFVAQDLADVPNVRILFLVQRDQESVRKVVSDRSKLPFIKTKTEEQQVSKVEKIQNAAKRIEERARAHNYPCVLAHGDETFKAALRYIEQ